MLSCKEVSRLNSQRFERPLTLREQSQIFLHLRLCDACKTVLAQLKFMQQAMSRYREGSPMKRDAQPGP